MKSKHTVRILASGIILFGSLIGSADATDTLKIYNNSGPVDQGEVRVQHRVGALEGWDTNDSEYLAPQTGSLSLYSDIDTHELERDARPIDSETTFDINLVYNGNLSTPKANNLRFEFGSEWFGTKPILFQSDKMPYGPVVDVRRAINQNGGNLPLIDLPANTYSPSTPYGTGTLDIGTRLLGDLNDDGDVNLEDFSILANDWLKTESGLVGDISGEYGIPDGTVDVYDLSAFSDDWSGSL